MLLAVLLALCASGRAEATAHPGPDPTATAPATLTAPLTATATPTPTAAPLDLAALSARARALHLADSPAWRRLGHWRPRWLGGVKGENDAPAFYRSPEGQYDPAAELDATLAGLLTPPPPGGDELADARCRFPARARYLAGALGFELDALPARPCPRLAEFVERVQARSVTVVFSSYYLNSPASAFGHTFLRLNRAETARAGKTQELLDYGVDYSAQVDTGNAVLYAVKGLFGLFKGTFNHYPYYYKVREYADFESRDLWEYDLDLAPAEVAQLVDHLWELGGAWFDYWYLDENCSYHVLGALEAAAPRLDLTSWVAPRPLTVPADTVKALLRNPGLVRASHYRPAVRTQFEARVRTLTPAAAGAVEALAADAAAPLPAAASPAEQAAALDAAADLLDLRHGKGMLLGEKPWASANRQALLVRRAGLRVVSPELVLPPPETLRPERGHGSLRAGLGGGLTRPLGTGRPQGGFATLDLRLCLHDLLDPPDGYPAHSQIEFLPTRLRWDARAARLELDETSAVRIVSLSPATRFDLRPSWRFRLGAEVLRDAGCDRCTAGVLAAGGGLAVALVPGALDAALFADAEVTGSAGLGGWGGGRLRVGLGPGGLLRARLGQKVALLAQGAWRWLPEAAPRETFGVDLAARFHLSRGLSLALEARRRPEEAALGLTLYAYDWL
ncbi:MAG: DUF4105 domain-containing protein [Anaeromyxobacter sp.]|nr:DUF4105 domain-containing protein [Anaeromyxobacter sp.]